VIFALNQLDRTEQRHQQRFVLAKRLDFRRFVAMGHSAGGAGATLACQLDAPSKRFGPRWRHAANAAFPRKSRRPLVHAARSPSLEIDHSDSGEGLTTHRTFDYLKKKKSSSTSAPRSYDVTLKSAGLVHARLQRLTRCCRAWPSGGNRTRPAPI